MKFLLFITLLFSISAFSFAGTVDIDQGFNATDNLIGPGSGGLTAYGNGLSSANDIGGGSSSLIARSSEDAEFRLIVTGENTRSHDEKIINLDNETATLKVMPFEVGWRSVSII